MSSKNCGGFSSPSQVGFDKDSSCTDVAEVSQCLGKEIFDLTVDIWDDPGCDGDNVVRVFNKDECVYHDGYFYWSLEDMNVDMPPTVKWSEGFTKCEMLKPSPTLMNCSGVAHEDGAQIPTCLDMVTADNTLAAAIQTKQDQLVKCSGEALVAGTPVVACDEFDGLFEDAFSKADLCIPVADVGQSCSPLAQLVAVENTPGCFSLGRVPAGSQCYGVIFNGIHSDVFPADTDGDSPELYSVDALQADYTAGTVDLALLDNSITAQGDITVPCDASYTFATTNSVVLTDAYLGTGQFIMTVDDVVLTNAAGQVVFSDLFTNQGGNFTQESWVGYLTAGTHTLKRHYLATADGSGNVAQIRRATGTTEVCKKGL